MTNRSSAELQGRSIWTRMSAGLVALALLAPAIRILADDDLAGAVVEPTAMVPGTLFICGGGKMPDPLMERFINFAGGDQAHIAVFTTASETADSPEVETRIDFWKKARLAEMTVLHTRSRETANDPEFCKPLATATGVWFIGGHQNRLTDAYRGTKAEQAIRSVLDRGGVVGGTSAGAAVMSPVMIRGGFQRAETEAGFGFLPGTVVDQHFLKRHREERLVDVLSRFPKLVGIGIDEGTAVVVQGRRLSVVRESESEVVTFLAAVEGKPTRKMVMKPGSQMDLVALRRAAVARINPRFRFDEEIAAPTVPEGTLVLSGGGQTPLEASQRFVEAAGGADAKIVVVTTADGDRPPPENDATGWLLSAGARHVRRIHPRTRHDAEDPALLELLRTAGGVWFTGGRQWRLVDALNDTAAEPLLQEVLKRGGAIGGSAAGASILASYLVRGNPLTNKPIMAEGYEDGFGLLPGVAVDPHFTQRRRFGDMAKLKQAYPQLIGLGVDDETAIVVKGHELEVVGRNRVFVFGRNEPAADARRGFDVLAAGDRYDLRDRKRMGSDRPELEPIELATSEAADSDENPDPDAAEPQPHPALLCE